MAHLHANKALLSSVKINSNKRSVRCRAAAPNDPENTAQGRRQAMALFGAAAASLALNRPEQAQAEIIGGDSSGKAIPGFGDKRPGYGEAGRVFAPSKETIDTDYQTYSGNGYTIELPMRGFNPVPPGLLARYDNVDVMWDDWQSTDYATISVSVVDGSGKDSLQDLQYLFGKDAWKCGDSNSCNDRYLEEQGFTSGSSVGHIMRVDKESKNGVTYNIYDVLTRYADGSQGGRWHMISAASKGGKTYVAHFVAGEKHWTKNKAIAEKVRSSLNVTA